MDLDQIVFDKEKWKDLHEVNYVKCTVCQLRWFDPVLTGTKDYYQKITQSDTYYAWEETRHDFLEAQKIVGKDSSVLDIGCGSGEFLKLLPSKTIRGIEFNPSAAARAVANGFDVVLEPIKEHAQKFPAFYDVITCVQVIEHVSSPNDFIRDILTCLKPGGRLVISTPNNDGYLKYMTNAFANLPPHHVTHWTESSLVHIATLFDLGVYAVSKETVTPSHKRDFAHSILLAYFSGMFGKQVKLLDYSLKFRLLNKLAKVFLPMLIKILDNDNLMPPGHTITVIYTKK
jgi:2-polyprenyl-3-methyl-5-hydroxy-6-metoxy-1,4-benzoquinol methylase